MKTRILKPSALIRAILEAGVRAILISVCIQVALVVLACGIGIGVWIASGFLSGIVAGCLIFVVGQAFAPLIIDMTLLVDDHPCKSRRLDSDSKVLADLKKELQTEAEQVEAPNRR